MQTNYFPPNNSMYGQQSGQIYQTTSQTTNQYTRKSKQEYVYDQNTGQFNLVYTDKITVVQPKQQYSYFGHTQRYCNQLKHLDFDSTFIKNSVSLFDKCGLKLCPADCKKIVTAFVRALKETYNITIRGCEKYSRLDMPIDALYSDDFLQEFNRQTNSMSIEVVEEYIKISIALIIISITSYILNPKHSIEIFDPYQ